MQFRNLIDAAAISIAYFLGVMNAGLGQCLLFIICWAMLSSVVEVLESRSEG